MSLFALSSRRNLLGLSTQCYDCIRQNAARRTPLKTSLNSALRQQTSSYHEVPILSQNAKLDQRGFLGFLSDTTFKVAWTDYQAMLIDRLNHMTAETPFETQNLKAIITQTAREPQFAAIFNYASMAYNNHFFFKGLYTEEHPPKMPLSLENELLKDFTSISDLREDMLGHAEAMFGPGFVWLVYLQGSESSKATGFRILNTYNAGTPFPEAHWREQSKDMNTENAQSFGALSQLNVAQNSPGAFGRGKIAKRFAPGAANVIPLLCLNTWEHVWLPDYGILSKTKYLEAWWESVDWEHVSSLWATVPKKLPFPAAYGR